MGNKKEQHDCTKPVPPKLRIQDLDPDSTGEMSRDEAEAYYLVLQSRLSVLQTALYAEDKQALLIILQAMDTGGKDSTIKKVMDSVNPLGVHITSFKKPSAEELDHDFLWRIHKAAPARGMIGIFNRSHYEDVLIVRVHGLVPKSLWETRYERINQWEDHLAHSGTRVLKIFLHISKDEQRERLQERLDNPQKHWKFNVADLRERGFWEDYMEAYEAVLQRCNTEHAPWYVIPANRKWFRNWAISKILVDTLEEMNPQYPQPDLTGVTIPE